MWLRTEYTLWPPLNDMIAKRGMERVIAARSLNQSSVHLRARYRETIRILRTELFPQGRRSDSSVALCDLPEEAILEPAKGSARELRDQWTQKTYRAGRGTNPVHKSKAAFKQLKSEISTLGQVLVKPGQLLTMSVTQRCQNHKKVR